MSKKEDLEPLFSLVDSLNKHKNKLQNKADLTAPSTPYQISKVGSPSTKIIMRIVIALSVFGIGALLWTLSQIKSPSERPNPAQLAGTNPSTVKNNSQATPPSIPTNFPKMTAPVMNARITAPVQTVPPRMQVREDPLQEQREREQREQEYDRAQGYEPPPAPINYDPNQNNNPNDNNISN